MQKKTIEGFRLSPQQKHLWLLQQAEPQQQPYRLQAAVRIAGRLDSKVLEQAVNDVVKRHEILRTAFYLLPEMTIPVQVISDACRLSLNELDLRGLKLKEQTAQIEALFQEARQQPFDFQQPPLLKVRLLMLSAEEHLLLIGLPALCMDTVGLHNMVREISRSYATLVQGEERVTDVMQYADFSEWQNELFESDEAEAGREYWRQRTLSDAPRQVLALEDRTRRERSFEPAQFVLPIDSELLEAIELHAQKFATSVGTFLLACWRVLLWRLTDRSELVINIACEGRNYEELTETLGLIAKYLPFHTSLEEEMRFSELLKRVDAATHDAYNWQDYFKWEQNSKSAENSPELDPQPAPFAFEFNEWPASQVAARVSFSLEKLYACLDRFKVKLSCIRKDGSLSAEIHYDSNALSKEGIARLAQQFHCLLENAAEQPDSSINRLEILSDTERRQLLEEWNETATDYPHDRCAHELFEEQVERTPDALAVVFGEQRLSYRELNRGANQLAHYLRELRVGPEQVVGILMNRSIEMVISVLGVLKAGGAYLPLDPEYPQERLSFMLEDADVKLLLTQRQLSTQLPSSQARVLAVDAQEEEGALLLRSGDNPDRRANVQNLSYVIYTSGSTGKPKGVMIEHSGLVNYLCWATAAYNVSEGGGAPLHSSLSFDLSVTSLFTPLLAGCLVHLLAEGLEALEQTLESGPQYSLVKLTPAHLEVLGRSLSAGNAQRQTRALIVGGEALSGESLNYWREHAPDTLVVNEYGPTETVVGCCVYSRTAAEIKEGAVSIGRPIANTELYILDERMEPVAVEVRGELYIGGRGVGRGYLNRPELTAERFLPHPFSRKSGERLYRTGDLARYLPDGNIEYLGRIDEQVKVRGYRVELGEIEAVLAEHELVREAVVLLREDVEGDKRLVAYVVMTDGQQLTSSELRSYLQERLPAYMIPSAFVQLDELPLTLNGKVDRKALPALEQSRIETASSYVAPRTKTEELLASIWAEALRVERVGVNDNFFELGGDSILSVQIIARANRAGLRLMPKQLFQHQTIAALAAAAVSTEKSSTQAHQAAITDSVSPTSVQPSLAFPLMNWGRREADEIIYALTGPAGQGEDNLIEEIYPLSPMQQGMLFHALYAPGRELYCVQLSCELPHGLNVKAFERAWEQVIERHAVLRTAFVWSQATEPFQVVYRREPVPLQQDDWREFTHEEQLRRLEHLLREDRRQDFDFARAPLMRLRLIHLSDEAYRFVWSFHHVLLDGWSGPLLVKEVFAYYHAYCRQQPLALPAVRPYRDYIAWLQQQDLSAAEAFWRRRLHGFAAPTSLPRAATTAGAEAEYEERERLIDRETTAALRRLGQRQQLTLNTIVQGAWAVLLSRYSGEEDVLFGATVSGRPAGLSGVEEMVGLFINTLPVRVKVEGEAAVVDWLQRLQSEQVEMREYEYSPLVEVQRWSEVGAGTPLFESLLVFENYPVETALVEQAEARVSDLEIRDVRATEQTNYPLTLVVFPGEELRIRINYDSRRFDAATIERLLGHLQTVIASIVANPEARLAGLPLLTEPERQQLIEWNDTKREYARDKCIHELFEEQVARTPDAVAVIFEDQQVSYSELNRRANQLARYLRTRGVGPEVRVGILLERSVEMVVGLLGILKAGGAYVPLDPEYPQERLRFMLKDAAATVLLTQQRLAGILPEHEAEIVVLDAEWKKIDECGGENFASRVSPSNLSYVIYTSGSTGQPKGVMIEHRSLVNYLSWTVNAYQVADACGAPLHSSLSFDLSVTSLFTPLLAGRPVHLLAEGLEALERTLESGPQYSLVKLTPAHLEVLGRSLRLEHAERQTNVLVVGGEALSGESLSYWREHAPQTVVVNEYGPTETVVGCCVYTRRAGEVGNGAVPIGRPIANTELYLLDERMEPVPVGVRGELYIGGAGVGRGYLSRPELTAEKFLPHPFSTEPGARLYRTGDIARYLEDGNIEYLGRIDEQVKVRGYRIELGEIEAVLKQHSGVGEAVVAVREDDLGERRLVAYIVAADGQHLASADLRSYLQERLPAYMIPSAFVQLDALPLTPNGKVDRRALPAPERSLRDAQDSYVAPRTPTEELLTSIWSEVLRAERVGVNDNFFELGGDSILSVQIVARANRAGLRLTPRLLFQHQTIAALAAAAASANGSPAHVQQGPVSGPLPLTPIQHWYFEQQLANPHHFNQALLLELAEEVDAASLEAAVNHLVTHHDALRLRFHQTESGWLQENLLSEPHQVFTVIDLSSLSGNELSSAIEAEAERMQHSLHLTKGPLVRVVLFKTAPPEPERLLVVIHHLAVDGVSWRILLEDLQQAYEQARRGEEVRLSAKTNSYQQWSDRLVQYAESATLEAEIGYWSELAGRHFEHLSVDYVEGSNSYAMAESVMVSLGQEETKSLLTEVPGVYHTQINDVLLTALGRTLCGWSGQERVLVEMEGHGRESLETEDESAENGGECGELDITRTVGWFTSIYPVALEVQAGSSASETLKQVKEQLRRIPQKGLGYGVLKYLSHREGLRERLRGVRSEVLFNYLGQVDQVVGEDSMYRAGREGSGAAQDEQGQRAYLLEIGGLVTEGQLRMSIRYSRELHRRETIERIAEETLGQLREIIRHCQNEGTGGYTPSDFPLLRLGQREVDELVSSLSVPASSTRNFLEEIYPLSPMQQGILFHSLYAPHAGLYFVQLNCALQGDFDLQAFERAWEQVIARHAVLRTAFVWSQATEPFQAAYRRLPLPLRQYDWRDLSPDEQLHSLEHLLKEDRRQGFDFARAPLMRLTLIRLSDDLYRFVWSFHHILLDGWSVSLLLKELFFSYEGYSKGQEVYLEQLRPYRDYIAWLQQQDLSAAEAFWRRRLSGFTAPTPLPTERSAGNHSTPHLSYEERKIALTVETTEALRRLGQRQQLTLNTIVQGAWAVLLSRYSGEEDVLFGATVSGRPAGLSGVEEMVGLFINTLPVRVKVEGEAAVVDWLQQLQSEQVEMREYEYSPLVEVQRWSEVGGGTPLFESLLAFENYPVGRSLVKRASEQTANLKVSDVYTSEQSNLPLALIVVPGEQLRIRASYESRRFDSALVERMLQHFEHLLHSIAANPDAKLGALAMLSDEEKVLLERTTTIDELEQSLSF
jgi:amino acid adenylation domain-containing protein/non-ribosomal peptide synthase protein (TIGR01720 family)